ncbi:MAG: exodeoxyribonuclease III [Anaerolineales bacterium]
MKIVTWNVNGLRAALRKGVWDWLSTDPADVLCLQETRAFPEQLVDEQHALWEDWHVTWNPAEKAGYSGVATFARTPPLAASTGLGDERFDSEGRVIRTSHPGFTLFNVYFPNGGRGHDRVQYKLDFYARLLEICDDLRATGEQVIMCGDFNTAHQEMDLRNPKENAETSGFLPEERAWVSRYLEHGFVDVYRQRYPEREQYTWWTYRGGARRRNVGWRIDYFLVSEGLLPRVEDSIIHDDVTGSDHCPVTLVLKD